MKDSISDVSFSCICISLQHKGQTAVCARNVLLNHTSFKHKINSKKSVLPLSSFSAVSFRSPIDF